MLVLVLLVLLAKEYKNVSLGIVSVAGLGIQDC